LCFTNDHSTLRRVKLLRHCLEQSKDKLRDHYLQDTIKETFARASRLCNQGSSKAVALDTTNNELNRQIHSYAGNYGVARYRSLCEDIQAILPRELRDMVYSYLVRDKQPFLEESDFLPFHHRRSTALGLPRSENRHLLDPCFSDSTTRREVFELWYKKTTFTFAYYNLVPAFLAKDFWNLDLPVRDLVRRDQVWPWAEVGVLRKIPLWRVADSIRILANVEPLFQFEKKVDIFIRLLSEFPNRLWSCIPRAEADNKWIAHVSKSSWEFMSRIDQLWVVKGGWLSCCRNRCTDGHDHLHEHHCLGYAYSRLQNTE
jgi:hypothetical protein